MSCVNTARRAGYSTTCVVLSFARRDSARGLIIVPRDAIAISTERKRVSFPNEKLTLSQLTRLLDSSDVRGISVEETASLCDIKMKKEEKCHIKETRDMKVAVAFLITPPTRMCLAFGLNFSSISRNENSE